MKITILGAGAIGSLWACKLAKDHQVQLWTREQNNQPKQIRLDSNPALTFQSNQVEFLSQSELIIVCVKAMQVKDALVPLLPLIRHQTPIILLHNGMGSTDDIRAALEDHAIYLATTTHAALKPNKQHVLHTGQGQTHIGRYQKNSSQLQKPVQQTEQESQWIEALNQALPQTLWHSNIMHALWNKLAINCAINPLTALLNCKNGHLADEKHQPQLDSVLYEIAQVLQSQGLNQTYESLKQTVLQVITATQDNYSSMHQDITHHRQTEIDFINAYLVKVAKKSNISTPINQSLVEKIKRLESKIISHQ